MRILKQWMATIVAAAMCAAAVPADSKGKKKTPPARPSSAASRNRRYLSSVGKPDPQAPSNKSPVKVVVRKVVAVRHVIPKGPPVSTSVRAEAHEGVFQKVA